MYTYIRSYMHDACSENRSMTLNSPILTAEVLGIDDAVFTNLSHPVIIIYRHVTAPAPGGSDTLCVFIQQRQRSVLSWVFIAVFRCPWLSITSMEVVYQSVLAISTESSVISYGSYRISIWLCSHASVYLRSVSYMYTCTALLFHTYVYMLWLISFRYQVNHAYWDSTGCVTADVNATHTTCHCYHLTNFALLIDLYDVRRMFTKYAVEVCNE